MSETVLQLESSIRELTREEQLWLLERIIHALRQSEVDERAAWASSIQEMANDPEIQSENQAIAREFAIADNDGLAGL